MFLSDFRVLLFPPVDSYHRLLIHKVIEDFPDLKSFSIGEGDDRRTVVTRKAIIRLSAEEMAQYGPKSGRGRGRGRARRYDAFGDGELDRDKEYYQPPRPTYRQSPGEDVYDDMRDDRSSPHMSSSRHERGRRSTQSSADGVYDDARDDRSNMSSRHDRNRRSMQSSADGLHDDARDDRSSPHMSSRHERGRRSTQSSTDGVYDDARDDRSSPHMSSSRHERGRRTAPQARNDDNNGGASSEKKKSRQRRPEIQVYVPRGKRLLQAAGPDQGESSARHGNMEDAPRNQEESNSRGRGRRVRMGAEPYVPRAMRMQYHMTAADNENNENLCKQRQRSCEADSRSSESPSRDQRMDLDDPSDSDRNRRCSRTSEERWESTPLATDVPSHGKRKRNNSGNDRSRLAQRNLEEPKKSFPDSERLRKCADPSVMSSDDDACWEMAPDSISQSMDTSELNSGSVPRDSGRNICSNTAAQSESSVLLSDGISQKVLEFDDYRGSLNTRENVASVATKDLEPTVSELPSIAPSASKCVQNSDQNSQVLTAEDNDALKFVTPPRYFEKNIKSLETSLALSDTSFVTCHDVTMGSNLENRFDSNVKLSVESNDSFSECQLNLDRTPADKNVPYEQKQEFEIECDTQTILNSTELSEVGPRLGESKESVMSPETVKISTEPLVHSETHIAKESEINFESSESKESAISEAHEANESLMCTESSESKESSSSETRKANESSMCADSSESKESASSETHEAKESSMCTESSESKESASSATCEANSLYTESSKNKESSSSETREAKESKSKESAIHEAKESLQSTEPSKSKESASSETHESSMNYESSENSCKKSLPDTEAKKFAITFESLEMCKESCGVSCEPSAADDALGSSANDALGSSDSLPETRAKDSHGEMETDKESSEVCPGPDEANEPAVTSDSLDAKEASLESGQERISSNPMDVDESFSNSNVKNKEPNLEQADLVELKFGNESADLPQDIINQCSIVVTESVELPREIVPCLSTEGTSVEVEAKSSSHEAGQKVFETEAQPVDETSKLGPKLPPKFVQSENNNEEFGKCLSSQDCERIIQEALMSSSHGRVMQVFNEVTDFSDITGSSFVNHDVDTVENYMGFVKGGKLSTVAGRSGRKGTSTPVDSGDCDDSWEKLFDDDGECLDSSLMDELTQAVGAVKVEKPGHDYTEFSPKEPDLDMEAFGHLVEIYDFPAEFITRDLLAIFSDFTSRGFDIKWVDDTHAIGIFSSPIAANDAVTLKHPLLKIRPITEASRQAKVKAKRCSEFMLPYKQRPETNVGVARRLVTGALGLGARVTREQREQERKQLKEAKEKKRLAAKQKQDAWDGTISKCAMDET